MNDMTQAPTPAPKPKVRPRPQVMRLTDAAAQRMLELTGRADSEIVGLRVGVKNGGRAGQSYTVEYAHEIRPTDEVVEDKGVKILVDPRPCCSCSAPRWTTRPTRCRAVRSSTTRTRYRPAVAVSSCS